MKKEEDSPVLEIALIQQINESWNTQKEQRKTENSGQ